MGLPAIFFVPHQDDETLIYGVEILRHLAVPRPVTVIIVGDGSTSGALAKLNGTVTCDWHGYVHDPAAEGRNVLTGAQMGAVRNTEVRSACTGMGVTEVVFAGRPEGQLSKQVWKDLLLEHEWRTVGGASVFVPTPWETTSGIGNPDHGNGGLAMQELRTEGHYADSAGVWVAYGVFSRYWAIPGCPQGLTRGPGSIEQQNRLLTAGDVYRAWNPHEGSLAIGWQHSVPGDFNEQFANTSSPRYLRGRYHN